MNQEDHYLKCPSCGAQSDVDPALLTNDAPMPYCKECDEPLISDKFINKQQSDRYDESQDYFWQQAIKLWLHNESLDELKSRFKITRI